MIELLFLNDKIPPPTSSTFNIIKNPSVYKHGGSPTRVSSFAPSCEEIGKLVRLVMTSSPPPPSLTWLGKFFFQRIWVGILTLHALNTLMWKYGRRELLNILNYSAAWIFHFSDLQFANCKTAKNMNLFYFKKTGSQTREYMTRNSQFLVYMMVISARLRREF